MTINSTVVVAGCTSSSGKFFTSFTDLTSYEKEMCTSTLGVHPRTKEWQILLKQIQKTKAIEKLEINISNKICVKYSVNDDTFKPMIKILES